MTTPVVAVIVAAGLGLRYGGSTPKPALTLAGKPLLSMSIEAMAAGGCTDVVVVLNEQLADAIGATLADAPIPVRQTLGGASRQESVHNGLKVVRDDERLAGTRVVLIHDAVRPMVPASVVAAVIRAVEGGAEAVAPALPVADSMRRVELDGSTEIVDRSNVRAIQTPQGFPFQVIMDAHDHLAATGAEFTDDLACAEQEGHQVVLVDGSRLSMKVTEPADLSVAEGLWQIRESLGHHDIGAKEPQ